MRHEAIATRVVTLTMAAALVAACTSSAGVHTQSPSSDASSTNVTSPVSGSSSPSWTPPDYGNAEPAVDAYLAFETLLDKAFRDPAHVRASTFDKFLSGQAKLLFDSALADEREQGKAYRGGAVLHHVRVAANHMTGGAIPWAALRDCQTDDPANPHVEYYVETGKPVRPASARRPTPYASTIKIFLVNGQWTVTQFKIDTRKACSP
jgi:hypothetical protein